MTDLPHSGSTDRSPDLPQEITALTDRLEALQQQNQALMHRIESLEGAINAAFEDQISNLEAGKGGEVFQQYHTFLVNSFTGSVIDQLFSSDHFVRRLLKSLRDYLLNVRGIVTILGLGALGAFGLNTIIESTAKAVFQDRIAAEYPQLLERLERDRETIMLLTLDISAQEQRSRTNLETADLSINPVRAAYLNNNPEYRKILVEFLEGKDDSSLLANTWQQDTHNKSIRRSYALNYILQVTADPIFKDALFTVLQDEDIEPDHNTSRLNLDTYNQMLAVRALRRYQNQMDNLSSDVLLNSHYENLFGTTFWRGFLNELITTPIEPADLSVIKKLVAAPQLADHADALASSMLVLYTLYPDLCEDNCQAQVAPWINAILDAQKRQREGGDPGKSSSTPSPDPELDSNLKPEQPEQPSICTRDLSQANLQQLLNYRRDQQLPSSASDLTTLVGTFNCILTTYHQDWQNFAFYQDPTLFYGNDAPEPLPGLTQLLRDYLALYWDVINRGQLAFLLADPDLNLDGTLNLYAHLQYNAQQQDTADFYGPLLEKTQYTYEAWVVPELHRRIKRGPSTQTAFIQWLDQQGYTADDPPDAWLLDSFLNSLTWSPGANRYLSTFEYSATELAQGRAMDQYLSIMERGYYPTQIWMNQIYPLFKDNWNQVVAFDQQQDSPELQPNALQIPVSGTEGEQNALWHWINQQISTEKLVFQDNRWQLK